MFFGCGVMAIERNLEREAFFERGFGVRKIGFNILVAWAEGWV